MTKLLRVVKSPKAEKKWRAVFQGESGREKNVDFGQKNAEDYLSHKDPERKQRYIDRHKKDLKTGDPTRAGYLSMEILWGPTTSFEENIRRYKAKYNL